MWGSNVNGSAGGDEAEEEAYHDSPELDDGQPIGVSVSDLARQAGVHRSTVYQWLRSTDAPPKLPDGSINAFAFGEWFSIRKRDSELQRLLGEDPLLATGSSPALESYREQRALLEGYKVEERRRSMVKVSECREVFELFSGIIQKAHQKIRERFGPEAFTILDEGLQEAQTHIETNLPVVTPETESACDPVPD